MKNISRFLVFAILALYLVLYFVSSVDGQSRTNQTRKKKPPKNKFKPTLTIKKKMKGTDEEEKKQIQCLVCQAEFVSDHWSGPAKSIQMISHQSFTKRPHPILLSLGDDGFQRGSPMLQSRLECDGDQAVSDQHLSDRDQILHYRNRSDPRRFRR